MRPLKRKRLTDSEIRSAVDKIRKRYGNYMVQFLKGRTALDSFEDRYIQAMRARLDLALFLHAEMTVVEELIKNEQERIDAAQQKERRVKKRQEENQSYADRVIAEHRRRIAKYPPLPIHTEASEEIERLFGCLCTLEREFWHDVETYMRSAYTTSVLSPRMRLEQGIIGMCRPSVEGLPSRLSRYRSLLGWTPRNWREIEKEEKKCLLEAAFFLHDLSDVLVEMKKSGNLANHEQNNVDNLLAYVHSLLDDFRLRDLKPMSH